MTTPLSYETFVSEGVQRANPACWDLLRNAFGVVPRLWIALLVK
jgi:hypothetical protein